MNALIIGSNKGPLLQHLPDQYLLIDDGPLIDALDLPARRAVTVLDLAKHTFNPLKDMDYLRAREFVDVLNAVFPEGESTLTRRYSNFVLLNALLGKPKRLGSLISQPDRKDTAALDAYQKVQTLLLSPVLERVLNRPSNMSFKGTIIARLDRAKLGDFDAFVLANFLISQYRGPVVIPDFGFYACAANEHLIRQDRLLAGINSFAEKPALLTQLSRFKTVIGRRCTIEDAVELAKYQCAALPNTDAYKDFIDARIA